MTAAATAPAPPLVKPRLRGVSHQVAAVLALPPVLALVAEARSPLARLAAAVYGASLVGLFVASAVYHRPTWTPRARARAGRVDHAAIFFLIAGTYTPIGLALGAGIGHVLLAVVWIGAAAGAGLAMGWDHAPKALRVAVYMMLGWAVVPAFPALLATRGGATLGLVVVGALLYTAGAVAFALRWPDPYPRTFGYQEVWHLMVIAAACCHFLAVERIVRAM